MAAAQCPWLVLTTLLVLLACSGSGAAKELTHLRFYYHEVSSATTNATIALVAGLNKTDSPFGDIFVFDNMLREGADPSSRLIGRARGTAVAASLDGSGALTTIEFVFTDYGNYSGSTLATVGHFIPTDKAAERSIVGGTGVLRFARGYFITDIISFAPTDEVAIIDLFFTTKL